MANDTDISNSELIAGGGLLAVVMAPFILGIALIGLSFRAPLAALLGALTSFAIFFLGQAVWDGMTAESSIFVRLLSACFFFAIGAGICYGFARRNAMERFFSWECAVIYRLIRQGGLPGRAAYVAIEFLPSILLVLVLGATLTDPAFRWSNSSGGLGADGILMLLILAWLAASQYFVLALHRTAHPVAQFLTVTGGQRPDTAEDALAE